MSHLITFIVQKATQERQIYMNGDHKKSQFEYNRICSFRAWNEINKSCSNGMTKFCYILRGTVLKPPAIVLLLYYNFFTLVCHILNALPKCPKVFLLYIITWFFYLKKIHKKHIDKWQEGK